MMPVIIVGGIGVLSSIILVIAAKVMAVPTDEAFETVREVLPGANCGGCGYAGCDDYARAITQDGVKLNLCPVGGSDLILKLSAIMGVEAVAADERHAIVRCLGDCTKTEPIMEYTGKPTCAACNLFYNGSGTCSVGCMGYGDCQVQCQYGAISIVDGIATIDPKLCVACGLCVGACPKHLITIIPKFSHVFVACSSHEKGGAKRKFCKAGCIGCKKCEKVCPTDAIKVVDNLAAVDPDKCINCGECVAVCPVNVIVMRDTGCAARVQA